MAKTKVELQNYQGESLSPITIASNVLYEDGRNAQEVFEEYSNETFTPTIENSSSMFKVGQGDSVDYSDNIVNGAYESMVLKGKSMVNCIQEPSSQDVVLPYEFEEGRYVTINDTKESGALGVELKGQTLVNLLNFNKIIANVTTYSKDGGKITVSSISERAWTSLDIFIESLKPNTDYILMIDSVSFTHSDNFPSTISVYCRDGNVKLGQLPSQSSNFFKFNTADKDLSLITLRIHATLGSVNSATTVVNGLRVLEYQEGMENWDIPYFEGMTSCKMPILHTVGKNLFGGELEIGSLSSTGNPVNDDNRKRSKDFFPFKGDVAYVIMNVEQLYFYDENKNFISRSANKTDVSPTNTCFIKVRTTGSTEVQIEKGTVATSYEPHKSSILSLPEEVVLRSLPNGVCDTFNTRTGIYTQNVKEVTFNGSENWIKGFRGDTTVVSMFYLQLEDLLTNADRDTNDLLVDKIFTSQPHAIWDKDVEGVHNKNSCLYININNSRMSDVTIEAFKTWLSQNPITVQYQLVEPIVTKINLPSTLKSWNTTTHIYSEIPENTLYPTLSHSNPTYPVILKPSTKYSIVANSYSNNHTNSTINFNLGGATASTTVGNRVTTITTPSTLSNELLTMSGRGNKLNNVMVIEGDVVGDEPYFEGMCDCKSPILSNVGKNLFDKNNVMKDKYISGAGKETSEVGTNRNATDFIQVKPNTSYLLSGIQNSGVTNSNKQFYVAQYDANKEIIVVTAPSVSSDYVKITTEAKTKYIRTTIKDDDLDRCQIEQSTQATPHEPYKSNILSCETYFDETTQSDKTIVLRSLPNGVCDTLNVETGEYVQRIGEIVLDGSSDENWNNNSNGENVETLTQFNIGASIYKGALPKTAKDESVVKNAFIQNMFAVQKSTVWVYQKGEACAIYMENPAHGSQAIQAKVLRSRLSSQDVAGWRALLQATPWILQYELATPIVSTIDIQGFPYAYENGHVQLSSGSIEQSLTPKVEYSVATNRNGQIRSNQKMVERHQKQLDQLQAIILANMVNTQYQQTLTTLNYDLLKKEVGE